MRSSLTTASGERPKILQRVLDNTGRLSILAFVGSIFYVYHAIGGNGPFAENTRISEHALMPGLVTERFNLGGKLGQHMRKLQTDVKRLRDLQNYICVNLEQSGISCHQQSWNTVATVKNSSGTNVYGIVRANRATGTEAMLIAVDINHREAVAIGLAYAAFSREQVYWARDIIFLFFDGDALALDAFLSRYHLVQPASLHAQFLPTSSGSIIGAVVVKTQKRSKSLDIEVNQLNGQLPNLDLFNSVVRIASSGKFRLRTVIYGVDTSEKGGSNADILVPLRALFVQAFTAIEGPHSVLGKYGVQGLSISLPIASKYPLEQSTKLIEAIARALNNILERFHQSYFLYILTSEGTFLSIAYYMPMMGVILPLLMFAYREWTSMKEFYIPTEWMVLHAAGGFTALFLPLYCSSATGTEMDWLLLIVICFPLGLFMSTPSETLCMLRFLLYLEFSIVAMSIALLNFSLGLIVSIVAVPIIIRLSSVNTSSSKALVRCAAGCMSHPLTLALLAYSFAYPYLQYHDGVPDITIKLAKSMVLRMLAEHILYSSWLFPLLCWIALPVWNILLIIAKTPSAELTMQIDIDSNKKDN